jgi:hypothetical protein
LTQCAIKHESVQYPTSPAPAKLLILVLFYTVVIVPLTH